MANESANLGLDPSAVWNYTVMDGVARWLSKSRQSMAGSSVRPVVVDDEEVVYEHEVRLSSAN